MFQPNGRRSDRWIGRALALAAWGMAAWAAYTAYRWADARRWPAVPCVVTKGRVEEDARDAKPFVFRVAYRYDWRGASRVGHILSDDYRGSDDVAEADRLAREFAPGSLARCFVNPADPSQAVLRHENPWLPAGLAAAMAFAGAFLLRAFSLRPGDLDAVAGPIILAVGLGGHALFFAGPLVTWYRSLGWRPTPCAIQTARVRSEFHGGLFSFTTYWPEVVYRYESAGRPYRSGTVNPSDVGTPWYYRARRVVLDHPARTTSTCYVDPTDPSRAVLDRSLSGSQAFGAWPLAMAVIGGAGVVDRLFKRRWDVSPRLLGGLALWAGTATVLATLVTTLSDLIRDVADGVAAWPEFAAVAVLVVLSAACTLGWAAVVAPDRFRRNRLALDATVWDTDLDPQKAPK